MYVLPEVLDAIRAHGEETYPEECCGFLLGRVAHGRNHVSRAHRAANQQADGRERRYHISPADYQAASRAADADGLDIVGFYHSHPDHPARPSATDLAEATFPGFSYVIVAVDKGASGELTAWTLATDRSRFESEEVVDARGRTTSENTFSNS